MIGGRKSMTQTNQLKLSFEKYTGANIRIALIDSGIDKDHSFLSNGIYYLQDFSLSTILQNDEIDYCKDLIGHGTACAGIITRKAPAVELLIIKIFDTEFTSSYSLLLKAIEYSIDQKVNIINLSLGMTQRIDYSELQALCNKAYENNIVIVAAENSDGIISYPACFENVFCVKAGKIYKKYGYFFKNDGSNNIIARGDHQKVDWLNGQNIFVAGSSFAAPHLSGIIALIMQSFPKVTIEKIKEILAANSEDTIPELFENHKSNLSTTSNEAMNELIIRQDISWIKRAILYPYNKEMHSLIRFRNLLPFEIVGVFDDPARLLCGKDPGEIIGVDSSEMKIDTINNLESFSNHFDTCILGYLDEITRIRKKNLLREIVCKSIEMGKNVYSLAQIPVESYKKIFELSLKKKLIIRYPSINSDIIKTIGLIKNNLNIPHKTPKVGIFGTSPNQGKFTTQLTLLDELKKNGYKVGTICTEHQAELFGVDFTFPMGYGNSVNLPIDSYPAVFRGVLSCMDIQRFDIIILSGQSGIIPYEIETYSPTYTLSSIAMLFGANPDAYILCINYHDNNSFISDSIHGLEILGKGKTILLVFSDHSNETKSTFGRSNFSYRKLTTSEINKRIEELEDKTSIPTTEVISEKGKKKLFDTVVNYFS